MYKSYVFRGIHGLLNFMQNSTKNIYQGKLEAEYVIKSGGRISSCERRKT